MTLLVLTLIASLLLAVGGLQWQLARQARQAEGQPAPELPPDIDAALRRRGSALLYCFSPSCAPCQIMTPRIERLMADHDNVFKVNLQTDPELARALGVRATPTTLRLADGRIESVHLGALSESNLTQLLA